MKYDDLLTKMPTKIVEIIKLTIKIYKELENRSFFVPGEKATEVTATETDKIALSCLCSLLLKEDEALIGNSNPKEIAKHILFDYGISLNTLKELTPEEYSKCFEESINSLFTDIKYCAELENKTEEELTTKDIEDFLLSLVCFEPVIFYTINEYFGEDAKEYLDNRSFLMVEIQEKSFTDFLEFVGVRLDNDEEIDFALEEKNYDNFLEFIGNVFDDNKEIDFALEEKNYDNFLEFIGNVFDDNKEMVFTPDRNSVSTGTKSSNQKSSSVKYGEFLTKNDYVTNPAIGREKELEDLMISILDYEKASLIIGESGVGKTALVQGLAYLIQRGEVPDKLKNINLIKINVSSIVQGCSYVGMIESRIETLIKEVSNVPNAVLFFDEMHTMIGAGSSSNSKVDIAELLKPYIQEGGINIIGATTNDEYYEQIKSNKAFARRFELINLKEPDYLTMLHILEEIIIKNKIKLEIEFNFDENEKSLILESIINVTDKKHQLYNDKSSNPELAISILRKAFVHAAYKDKVSVEIEDIAEAIINCERIYESARNKQAIALLEMFKRPQEEIKEKQYLETKLIMFPTK